MRCKVIDSNSQRSGSSSTTKTAGLGIVPIVALPPRLGGWVWHPRYASSMDHTFAIPVYRAAPNLADADRIAARAERGRSEILLASSTPSAELEAFAKRYALALHINPQRIDIAADWNFALQAAQTELVTLAHQDDLFAPAYAHGWRRTAPPSGRTLCLLRLFGAYAAGCAPRPISTCVSSARFAGAPSAGANVLPSPATRCVCCPSATRSAVRA